MGDEQDTQAALLEVTEDVQDIDPGRRVQHADDLVGDQELDVEDERARDEQALKLAPTQLVWVLAEHVAWLEPDVLQASLPPRTPLVAGQFGEIRVANHLEDTVDLEDRVVPAERILEHALHAAVVAAAGRRPSSETSCPSNVIEPSVTSVSRRIIFPTVVLPLPLSPISDTISPGRMSNVTSAASR